MNQLSLVQAIVRLGQGVVIGVRFAANRMLDTRPDPPLGITNADVLGPAIRVTYKAAVAFGLAGIQCLFQRIQIESFSN